MLVARDQSFVGDISKARAHGGRVDFRADNMNRDTLPVVGDSFALEDIAIQNARFIGDCDGLAIAALGHLDSGAGAGIIAIDI
jgi:hypothetical protein